MSNVVSKDENRNKFINRFKVLSTENTVHFTIYIKYMVQIAGCQRVLDYMV